MIGKLITRIRTLVGLANGPDTSSSAAEKPAGPSHGSGPFPQPKAQTGNSPQKDRRRRKKAAPPEPGQTAAPDSPPWHRELFDVPPAPGKIRFHDLDIPDVVLHGIADIGFQYTTPIQAEILPECLSGRDAFGRAQTGTGKTAAFLITIFTRLLNSPIRGKRSPGVPRALVIAPTRELVMQIADEAHLLAKYTGLTIVSVFGGMDYEKQRRQLLSGHVDVVAATPGRLLDFKRRKDLDLGKVEILVIDEADRMLDMGFIPDVRQIVYSTPPKDRRQTLFFSATLTPDVTRLSSSWTRNPVSVEIEPEQVAVDTVSQRVYIVTTDEKFALTYNIITQQNLRQVLVFCNRRDETRRLSELLTRYQIDCAVLSGEVPQKKRVQTLDQFKAGKIRVLVATDVAGRGIHIEGMDYVINFTLPHDPEDYVHRIGRTGRAGSAGTAISFACEDDSFYIPAIEAFIGNPLTCTLPEETWLVLPPPPPKPPRAPGTFSAGSAKAGAPESGKPRRRRRPPGGSSQKDGRNRPRPPRSDPKRSGPSGQKKTDP
ncbi:DEAD/DEAH box helicase [Desulfosarcina sp. OttesenSCG-928-A07]|nr:DEAD/DEAH box helicase [Desulfosarcina sp. OttesenSCG-928-G17]MDL2328150.1 DEAD/DEAH box helicase [Desulfosarcina sp. OttesenSCG-928-A07]